jgi:hypothetical protein
MKRATARRRLARALALRGMAATVVCAAALPAPTAAAIPPGRAGLYGGGAVRDYMHFVSLRVQRDGRFSSQATLVTKCTPRFGDTLTESVSVRDQRLSSTGRFSATTTFSDVIAPGIPSVGGLRAEGTIASSIEVRRGGVARGVVRVMTTYSDPAPARSWRAATPGAFSGRHAGRPPTPPPGRR